MRAGKDALIREMVYGCECRIALDKVNPYRVLWVVRVCTCFYSVSGVWHLVRSSSCSFVRWQKGQKVKVICV